MRLSEAILLGSTMKPQTFGAISWDGKTCAVGAAYDAAGILEAILALPRDLEVRTDKGRALISGTFPGAYKVVTRCPLCRKNDDSLLYVVIHLNDDHKWTRERIAEWVATVEPAEEPVTAPEVTEREIVSVEP